MREIKCNNIEINFKIKDRRQSRMNSEHAVNLTMKWREVVVESLDRATKKKLRPGEEMGGGKEAEGEMAKFCRRPLSGSSGMKSPGDREAAGSWGVIDDLSKSFLLLRATPRPLSRVQGSSDPQKRTRPSLPPRGNKYFRKCVCMCVCVCSYELSNVSLLAQFLHLILTQGVFFF